MFNGRWTRRELREHLTALGLVPGDSVMVHASLRRVGPMLNGPDALIGALLDTISPGSTLLAYTDWDALYEDALADDGRVPHRLRAHIPPFDPVASRACRAHGATAEFIRTTPGALRSGNPGASVAAVGARAQWFVENHPLDYGYGSDSPFGKLVAAAGKVLMAGAPYDTMSILHHAEQLANIPGKRIRRVETPLLIDGVARWHMIEEFDTADPVVDGLPDDYFRLVVEDYMASGAPHRRGTIGNADSLLVPAREVVEFTVQWLESWASSRRPP